MIEAKMPSIRSTLGNRAQQDILSAASLSILRKVAVIGLVLSDRAMHIRNMIDPDDFKPKKLVMADVGNMILWHRHLARACPGSAKRADSCCTCVLRSP